MLFALICVDVAALDRRSRFGGIATGLAAAVKVTPLALVGLLALSRRRADATRSTFTFALATATGCVLLPGESRTYWTETVFATNRAGNNASLRSLATLVPGGPSIHQTIWLTVSAGLVVIAARRCRDMLQHDVAGAFAIGMCLTFAISPITWVHHMMFCIIAIMLWIARSNRPWHRAVIAILRCPHSSTPSDGDPTRGPSPWCGDCSPRSPSWHSPQIQEHRPRRASGVTAS